MKKLLVVVDYQNDFVDGALGFEKAKTLEEGIVEKIKNYAKKDGRIIFTYDTHHDDYLETREGRNLPIPHCIECSEGHELYGGVGIKSKFIDRKNIIELNKNSFGIDPFDMCILSRRYKDIEEIEIIGIVTNMCVISNVVAFQSTFPDAQMIVDASLCASFDDEMHEKALDVMESMQVKIINREVK